MAATVNGDRRTLPVKLFIGGITRNTTTKTLRDHFSAYGSVLDCVAMRQPDGRPRGFGYVTLDSPAAADRCLAVSQVVDGRVVDMKRAVPEGSDGSPKSADPNLSRLGPMRVQMPGYCPWGAHAPCYATASSMSVGQAPGLTAARPMFLEQPATHSLWPGLTHPDFAGDVPDFVKLLGGHVSDLASTSHGRALGGHFAWPRSPGPSKVEPSVGEPIIASASLSAGAPEFVPTIAPPSQPPREQFAVKSPHAAIAPPQEPTNAVQQLCDITNIVNNNDCFVQALRTKQPKEDDQLRPIGAAPNSKVAAGGSHTKMEILEDSSDDENCDAGSAMDVDANLPLPSMGSADHAAGNCKRCNFFIKGRCQNGQDCVFCHFPHDKRKFSRQEKRERRATWLANTGEYDEDSCSDAQTGSQIITLPGMPQTRATMLPGPPSLADHYKMPPALLGMPRSLPPGLDLMFQPEEELSPTCSLPYTSLPSTPAHNIQALLSTVPRGPSAPKTAPAALVGTITSGMLREELVVEPATTCNKETIMKPLAVGKKEMCTIGIQTEVEASIACTRCRTEICRAVGTCEPKVAC